MLCCAGRLLTSDRSAHAVPIQCCEELHQFCDDKVQLIP